MICRGRVGTFFLDPLPAKWVNFFLYPSLQRHSKTSQENLEATVVKTFSSNLFPPCEADLTP